MVLRARISALWISIWFNFRIKNKPRMHFELRSRTSYIICGAQYTVKMQDPCLKIIKNCRIIKNWVWGTSKHRAPWGYPRAHLWSWPCLGSRSDGIAHPSSKWQPRLVWLSGLSAALQTKGSLVWFPVRSHAWVVCPVSSRGHVRGNHTLMFLSRSFSLPSLLSKIE